MILPISTKHTEKQAIQLIKLDLDGEEIPVLIREVQANPVKDLDFLHVDF